MSKLQGIIKYLGESHLVPTTAQTSLTVREQDIIDVQAEILPSTLGEKTFSLAERVSYLFQTAREHLGGIPLQGLIGTAKPGFSEAFYEDVGGLGLITSYETALTNGPNGMVLAALLR